MNKTKAVLLILPLLTVSSSFRPQIGNFTSSESFVTPNHIFTLSCIVNDLDGRETIENATIKLEDVILLWKNETNSFSMIQNLNNYARLEYGSYSEILNTTARTLFFRLSFRGNMTEGSVNVLTSGTKVFDDSGVYGSGHYTSLFVFGPEPEAWQQNPYPLQPVRPLGSSEAVIIGIVFMVVLILVAVFSKREKSTQEKYHELIDVRPKERKK